MFDTEHERQHVVQYVNLFQRENCKEKIERQKREKKGRMLSMLMLVPLCSIIQAYMQIVVLLNLDIYFNSLLLCFIFRLRLCVAVMAMSVGAWAWYGSGDSTCGNSSVSTCITFLFFHRIAFGNFKPQYAQ